MCILRAGDHFAWRLKKTQRNWHNRGENRICPAKHG